MSEVFKEVFLQKCEEDDIPVFAVRHYCVVRKPLLSLEIREGSKEEVVENDRGQGIHTEYYMKDG